MHSRTSDLSVHWQQACRRRHASRYQKAADKAHERRLRLHHEQESLLTAQTVLQAALPLRITTLIKLFFRRLKRMRLQNMPASFLLNTILKIFSEQRIS